MKLSDGRARLLIAAWKLVPAMTFENGSVFDAKCLFRSEGRGAKGAMLKLDRIEDLIDVKDKYLELEAHGAVAISNRRKKRKKKR